METIKHLLPPVQKYYKANLHTHSTVSDGSYTPEQMKAFYKSKGYQILALTDHNTIVDHSVLNEPDFLMLTGTEVNFNHPDYRPGYSGGTYHINLIAKRPDNLWLPGKPYPVYPDGYTQKDKITFQHMDIEHTPESINAMIEKANEMGFLVSYNHPTWSCHSYPDYATLKGLWAMELCNGECCVLGIDEHNHRVLKDLQNLGNRLYPLGADDAHDRRAIGRAWIMVGAEELRYDSVIEALEKGDFYMSTGPEFHSLTIEGDVLHLTCSDAKRIAWETHGRLAWAEEAEGDNWLNEGTYTLTSLFKHANGDPNAYIRFTVTAPDGSYASTRAYYLSDLLQTNK